MAAMLETLGWIALAFVLAHGLGYGVATLLWPRDHDDSRWAAMPTVGFSVLCLLGVSLSGNFGLPAAKAAPAAALALLALSAVVALRRRGARAEPVPVRRLAFVALPTLALVLGPVVVQGLDLYLGSANLDFFQSLVFHDVLVREGLSFYAHWQAPTAARSLELAAKVWPDPLQARFGAVIVSLALATGEALASKPALTLATALFALCLPGAGYAFSRVVLGFSPRAAALSGALLGIAAPVSMSFLIVLVGQGSGLPILPVLVAALYLALTQPSPRTFALAAILAAALFVIYAMMLPFALAPMGLFALWRLARGRLPWHAALGLAIAGAAALALAYAGMLPSLAGFLQGLRDVGGRLVGTLFFVDFLTEQFFVYFLGITSHSANNSLLHAKLLEVFPEWVAWGAPLALAFGVLAFVVGAGVAWSRRQSVPERRVAVACLVLVYGAVWAYFTFAKPYGYSVFKMATWLQFAVVPFVAWGLLHFRRAGASASGARDFAFAAGLAWIATNLVATVDYAGMSWGGNRERGKIVNAFGMGANPEVPRLGRDLAPLLTPERTVGLSFTDTFQNFWAAYRLTGKAVQGIVAHELFPEDDSYLPHPATRLSRDSSGEEKVAARLVHADVATDWWLLPGKGNQNPEIVAPRLPAPHWENATYQVHRTERLRDHLFTGRGFYRSEFLAGGKPWWVPEGVNRWTREGFELYLLQASRPGEDYRVAFTAQVGYGHPSSGRTLEFWHDGVKFDEQRLEDTGRVVSAPFRPKGGLDLVTVTIREKTAIVPRGMGLWHTDYPRDTRHLNLLVSRVELVAPGDRPPVRLGGKPVAGKAIHDAAWRYDGLSVAGWTGAEARFAFVSPHDRPRVSLDVHVPGNLGFAFPYRIVVNAEGVTHEFSAKEPGPLRLAFTVPSGRAGEPVSLTLVPQAAAPAGDAFLRAQRPHVEGVRLDAVQFLPQP